MTAIVVVCAYNEQIGAYAPSGRIENGGYFIFAVLIVMLFLSLVEDGLIIFVSVGGVLVFVCAGIVGGVDYGSDWLYDHMDMQMTTNGFLIVIAIVVILLMLIYWRMSLSPYYKWVISICIISISDALAFSIITGRLSGWYNDTGDSYDVLDFSLIALYILLGVSWYMVPSYLTYEPRLEGTSKERQPLIEV